MPSGASGKKTPLSDRKRAQISKRTRHESFREQAGEIVKGMVANSNDKAEGFGMDEVTEMGSWMGRFETQCSADFEDQVRAEVQPGYHKTTQFAFLDVAPYCRDAMSAILQDSFTRCFENKNQPPWNFTFYLLPLSYMSVLVRYCILLPIRMLILLTGLFIFGAMITLAQIFSNKKATAIKQAAIKFMAHAFLFSWCAVVIEEGTRPPRRPGQIYVANHSTVFDVVLLLKNQPFALTGQAHGGLIGFFQKYVLDVMENMWFDRMASKDRQYVAQRIKEHAADVTKPPLLVFPEGTCVNNEHIVMFKRGAFQLGTSIVPVAIKFNKIFVDGYWNSREQSIQRHMLRLMTAWSLVVEVKYLDPQTKRRGETATAFASRVKLMIAKAAGLNPVPWDGYLKYYKPRPEYKDSRQRVYAKMLRQRFELGPIVITPLSKDTNATTDEVKEAAVGASGSSALNAVAEKAPVAAAEGLKRRPAATRTVSEP